MCGIVGIFDTKWKRNIDRDLLDRMNESQLHRGPDDGGIYVDDGVGVGHRRLSIIDLSSGQQPLFNEDGSVVVVYNGEIYNYIELADRLIELGHVFKTHCDTEVIVHAWEEWGEKCVDKFRGMFAFGLWDRNKETLFLARDRMGIKPLFYSLLSNDLLIFSSELKALFLHPDLVKNIDSRAIEEYFGFGYIPDPRTIFNETFKLPPGHTLTIKRGKPIPETKQYWDIPFSHVSVNEDEAKTELISRLREAVDIRLVSEVPLGAFLSGGVDSSAIVALMAGLSDKPVNTSSISFGDPKFNESRYADSIAERYHTNHFVEQVEPNDFNLIDSLSGFYDEPYADSSAIPTYRVCELAKKRVTVALSGDGGDENLAGYRRYRWHTYEERMRSLLPLGVRKPAFNFLGNVYPKLDWMPKIFRAKTTFQAMARDNVAGYFHSVSLLSDDMRSKLFSSSFSDDLQGYNAVEVMRKHAENSPTDHPLSLVQYLDMKTYLPGDILTKVDRASMANSLEVRIPLLDHKLVEWMSGLHPNLKLNGREGKYLFKKSLEPMISNDILYRQKMGFAVPLAGWFRGPLKEKVRDSLLGEVLSDANIFDRNYLKQMINHHQSGVRDYSAPIWSLLMFESFYRKTIN